MAGKGGRISPKTQFRPGQSGNPKGRPPLPMTVLIDQLKKSGIERVSAAAVQEKLEYLLACTPDQVEELASHPKASIVEAIIATHLLSLDDRLNLLLNLLDRVHGKPKQAVDVTSEGKALGTRVLAPIIPDE